SCSTSFTSLAQILERTREALLTVSSAIYSILLLCIEPSISVLGNEPCHNRPHTLILLGVLLTEFTPLSSSKFSRTNTSGSRLRILHTWEIRGIVTLSNGLGNCCKTHFGISSTKLIYKLDKVLLTLRECINSVPSFAFRTIMLDQLIPSCDVICLS